MAVHGYTITKAQADLGNQRIQGEKLQDRAEIFHADSSADPFPAVYELIFGIEVSCHIRDKQGLFSNIAQSLAKDGTLLLMDFIANLKGGIVDTNIEIAISTQEEWVQALSSQGLVIQSLIDVSGEIANFLHDPDSETHIAHLPDVVRASYRNFVNCSVSIEKGWLSYCLFRIRKALPSEDPGKINAHWIRNRIPYAKALAAMLKKGRMPYPPASPLLEKIRQEERPAAPVPPPGNKTKPEAVRHPVADGRPGKTVCETLIRIVSGILDLSSDEARALDENSAFRDLGIGSLNAVEITEAVNTRFHLNLPSSIVFECSRFKALAGHVETAVQKTGTRWEPETASAPNPAPESRPESFTVREATVMPAAPPSRVSCPASGRPGIAVTGISCRCAGAGDVAAFQDLVFNGVDAIREPDDPSWIRYFKAHAEKPKVFRYGRMDGIDCFDPLFFNISPAEAAAMDPPQRVILEEVYKALEDANLPPEKLKGRSVSVLVGAMGSASLNDDFSHLAMLGADTSILAARIAYFLDLKGPSLAVNTACSSSLAAIDMACKKLHAREIDTAIAGGITLYTHPKAFVWMSNAGMLSPTGQCRPFDRDADGMVAGDGVGIVILKRLEDALRDRDFIYGVIRASGTNQDGQTSGITVPSFLSQSRLEERVYREGGIHAADIQYAETHGTATKLGDPIEIHALTRAFSRFTDKKGFCRIGSVKANIGHTTAASGVLSLIKVLLCMNQGTFAPSLHFERPNPQIDFENSPFRVSQAADPWPLNASGTRLATVSAFGFSGTNAHLVVESSPVSPKTGADKTAIPGSVRGEGSELVVLSAKSEKALKQRAADLAVHLDRHPGTVLRDLSRTLAAGRDAMAYRLAVVADACESLSEKLAAFAKTPAPPRPDLFWGAPLSKKERDLDDTRRRDLDALLAEWDSQGPLRKRHLQDLARFWTLGLNIDFASHAGPGEWKKLSGLPPYPFEKETFMGRQTGLFPASPGISHAGIQPLHPLVHQNLSNAGELKFTSIFTGREFFFDHHRIEGKALLPGVAFLEMALAAIRLAFPNRAGFPDRAGFPILRNIAWIAPMDAETGQQGVETVLEPLPDKSIRFSVRTAVPGKEGHALSLCAGTAVFGAQEAAEPLPLDIPSLRQTCGETRLPGTAVYQRFSKTGIEYGPGFQRIQTIRTGKGKALASLSGKDEYAQEPAKAFILDPGLADAALQAGILLAPETGPARPALPFALESLTLFDPSGIPALAFTREQVRAPEDPSGARVRKLDIDLADESGKILAAFRGLSSRSPDTGPASGQKLVFIGAELVEKAADDTLIGPDFDTLHVLVCGTFQVDGEEIRKRLPKARLEILSLLDGRDAAERFTDLAARVFQKVQDLFKAGPPSGKMLFQAVLPSVGENLCLSGLSGLLAAANLENPDFFGQVIGLDPEMTDSKTLARILDDNRRHYRDNRILYRQGHRMVPRLSELTLPKKEAKPPWRNGKVYLITGGGGGLGRIFARAMAESLKEGVLVLAGRKPPEMEPQAFSGHPGQKGFCVEFRTCDVTRESDVRALVKGVLQDHGSLDGVIHGAGQIQDNYIIRKDKKEFCSVLGPKVAGAVFLDKATQDLGLDFFILFSSIAGIAASPGQADYSAANAFLDRFAQRRNQKAQKGWRSGTTLSVNWGLWKNGGMHAAPETEQMITERTGMAPMESKAGVEALYRMFAFGKTADLDQAAVLAGTPSRILESLHAAVQPGGASVSHPSTQSPEEEDRLLEPVVRLLKQALSGVIRLAPSRIDASAELEAYGMDSVMAMQLTDTLEKTFGTLSKTLFFEYRTLEDLAAHLAVKFPDHIRGLSGEPEKKGEDSPASAQIFTGPRPVAPPGPAIPPAAKPRDRSSASPPGPRDIAVIGLAGFFPGANTPEEFWTLLKNGADCIVPVPEDRWNHAPYFDPERDKPGKTYCRWGSFIDGVDRFDPLFFKISPKEASLMDPKERLFLTCVWNLMEQSGYSRERIQKHLQSRVGVFAGAMYPNYHDLTADTEAEAAVSLSSYGIMANRVSHFFNFMGPSIAVDTMCSSAATAIHMACESLIKKECRMAVAGAANLTLHPKKYLGLSQSGIIGSSPESRSFADGDGYLPAECVGAVLFKPLEAAEKDRDRILAVVKSTAANHSGHTHGFSVPNPHAQEQLIRDNFNRSGIHPRTISYVESAANGSALGDPIEFNALNRAFQSFTRDRGFCPIGSVKSNIGHPEAASGMAQVAKVILQMRHGALAPTLVQGPLNPKIDFTDSAFTLQTGLAQWKRPRLALDGAPREYPRRAAISSFGAGGSNVHLILEEYRPDVRPVPEHGFAETPGAAQVFLFSARTREKLMEVAGQMHDFLIVRAGLGVSDLALTLRQREAMAHRLAVVADSVESLVRALARFTKSGRTKEAGPGAFASAGCIRNPSENLSRLISRKALEDAMASLVRDRDLEKIAVNWTCGNPVPWEELPLDPSARPIDLPGYPFSRERCWIGEKPVKAPESRSVSESGPREPVPREPVPREPAPLNPAETTRDFICGFLGQTLGMAPERLKLDRDLEDFGVDSVVRMKLARAIEKHLGKRIASRVMVECTTIQALAQKIDALPGGSGGSAGTDGSDASAETGGSDGSAGTGGSDASAETGGSNGSAETGDSNGSAETAGTNVSTPLAKPLKNDFQILEAFRQGRISMETIKKMFSKGEIIRAGASWPATAGQRRVK